MSLTPHRYFRVSRWLALSLTLVLVTNCLIHPIAGVAGEGKPLKSRSGKAQRKGPAGNGKEKRVPPVPPQPGAPQLMLPDLQTERQREQPAPQPPAALASTIRSKRKPVESREGRKVGDRLRPRGRSHHASSVRRSLSRSPRGHALAKAPAMTLVFTNDPLTAGIPIKAIHITELREAINDARGAANLSAASWAESIIPGATFVKASHITEMRLRLDEARSALGLSTGGYIDAGLNSGYDIKATHIQQLRARVRQIVDASASDSFVQNFLQWGLGRDPSPAESDYWSEIMRAAHPQGQASRLMAAYELGMTVFDSAAYADRNRNNQQYVSDLYHAYLMRAPETCDPNDPYCGPNFWANACNSIGRAAVRQAFEDALEFQDLVAAMTTSGMPSSSAASLATARTDLFNQSGNQTRARDCEWSLPLISLPGRAGLDLGVSLSYSSLVWTRSGPYVYFNPDNESLSPGFTIGFPSVQFRSFDAQTARNVYILTAAGRRTELRQLGTSNVYESADSSYLQLIDYGGSLLLRTTDGTQLSYSAYANGWQVTEIKDRNGNLILVNNDWRGDIQSITDTLGRVIDFHYDGNANLSSITQTWNGAARPWATFGWGNHSMANSLSSQVVGTHNGETNPVLTQVGLEDGSRYNFEYTGNAQVNVIRRYTADNNQRSYTAYDYQGAADCPRVYQTRVSAENWTGVNGVPGEVVTSFSDNGDNTHQITVPDGTIYKEFYGGTGGSPMWQKGLVIQTEVWSGGVRQKWTTTGYDHDNTSGSYQTNPRVTETNIYDAGNNRRRTTIDYSQSAYVQFGLPYFVSEYDGTTEIRRSYTDYNLSQAYLDRRIIGLVSMRRLYDVVTGWQVKTTYGYDSGAINSQATSAPGHDQSYDASLTARGNVTSVSRWDVTDIDNASKALTSYVSYDAAGNLRTSIDPATHQSSIGYSDAFPGTYSGANTFAYPTTATDADGNSSYIRYNYYFGAKTQVQGPPPAGQSNGIIQTFTYDEARRVKRATVANTGAYTHYEYGLNYTQVFSSVNTVSTDPLASDSYSVQVFDGLGRVFAAAGFHPGSSGGYKAQWTQFDAMGRAMKQSNPTEITGGWAPAGDDVAGFLYTQQNYDWQGRPLYTTNTDGTQKYASYSGCGCAGGEMVTLTDEVGRQQKVYSDVLGRQWKREVLNWNGSVYSTVTNTLNALDQITNVRQTGNATGVYQDTVMTFDGYGRLASKHVPEQNAGTATVFAYNSDDLIQSVTDARGASATYGYNSRHLVTSIAYSTPAGITPTGNVTFGHDAAGNRVSLTDGLGSRSYSYNQLSQMISETRTFSGVGTFTLGYDYNLAGQLKKLTDSTNMTVNYGFDSVGRLSGVTGADVLVGGVSNYASSLAYRAWGGLKQLSVGSHTTSLIHDSRMRASNFNITGVVNENYDYFADGRLRFLDNTTDANFDRSFSYDHTGRLTEAFAGGAARNDSGDVPMYETFDYNPFNNTTSRHTESWGNPFSDFAGGYSNNRRVEWGYDADGRIATIDTRSYTYNSAGQNIFLSGQRWTPSGNVPVSTTSDFDGDGNRIREVSNNSGTQITTYYLRSSVLGSLVEELSDAGVKQTGYVYTPAGALLATQVVASDSVTFKHLSPTDSSQYEFTSSVYGSVHRKEFDPAGATVPLFSHSPGHGGSPGEIPDGGGALDGRGGAMSNPAGGCLWDGIWSPCDMANRALGADAASIVAVGSTAGTPAALQKAFWVEGNASRGVVDRKTGILNVFAIGGHYEWLPDWEPLAQTNSAIAQRTGLKMPLSQNDATLYERERLGALGRLAFSKSCRDFLGTHGINVKDLMSAVRSQRPFDGKKSTLSRKAAGTLDPDSDDRFGSVPVSYSFRENSGTNAEAAIYPDRQRVEWTTLEERSDIYFRRSGINAATILHEALHSLLGETDDLLQLRFNLSTREPTYNITEELRKQGCAE